MKKQQSTSGSTSRNNRNQQPQEQRKDNRRRVNCDGYAYIPMVGWYCCRQKNRRNGVGNQQ